MCENKNECPTARMLRVPQSTRWDSDLVERMFADLPFKPRDTSFQSSNRVDNFLKRTVNVAEKDPGRIDFTLLNRCIPNSCKQNNQISRIIQTSLTKRELYVFIAVTAWAGIWILHRKSPPNRGSVP
ncbi:hypothetical protein CHU72_08410 [Corynebacterium sp. LK12]|nr:hypothetical protein CHU72_08410 [Corynebacterium sp. LK12]